MAGVLEAVDVVEEAGAGFGGVEGGIDGGGFAGAVVVPECLLSGDNLDQELLGEVAGLVFGG